MIVYRIAERRHAADITGAGAAIYGGRWNRKGTPVLYTGETPAIALLELVVHTPPMLVPDLDILYIEIPDDSITALDIADLPENWMNYPAPTILSELAAQWVKAGNTISLKVPSCIIHSSHNYILNCSHPQYTTRIKVIEHKGFRFDPRLTS